MTVFQARTFFSGERPHGIPGDAAIPDWDALVERAGSLSGTAYPHGAVRDILVREHLDYGADEAAMSAAGAIDERTVYVIAGQQAGLFGGPLYTIYKAMHTIRLAERLRAETGRPVQPLFWVASDDHDFDEVRRIGARTHDGTSETIEYTPDMWRDGMPVGDVVLDAGIGAVIRQLGQTLGQGDRARQYIELLHECWRPGERWVRAFIRHILRIFAGTGLLVFDPRAAGAKRLFLEVMGREIAQPLASSERINETADAFESSNDRKHAIRRPEGSTNLFYETGGRRHPLFFQDGRFRAGDVVRTPDELSTILNNSPSLFSPGAALRPVCQDAVFPTVALISGPGERRYLSQVASLYSMFDVDGATIWPRASFTVIDPRVVRAAEKEGIAPERLFDDPEHLRSLLAAESLPESLENVLNGIVAAVSDGFGSLEHEMAAMDKSLLGAVEKEKGRMLHIMDGLRGRAVKARKSTLAISEQRLAAGTYAVLPNGGAQERWFGYDTLVPYIGDGEFAGLIECASPEEECHRIIVLE